MEVETPAHVSDPAVTKIAACLYVRDAEHDIQEWICYHHVIGTDTFFIYDNGSRDLTVPKAEALASRLDVRIIPWGHATGPSAQGEAYMDCLARFGLAFDWMLILDSDEFLASVDGQHLPALLAQHPAAAGVVFNWALFGSNGHEADPGGLVIECFDRRGQDDFAANAHTKMIVRPSQVRNYVNPHFFLTDGPLVRAGGGPLTWRQPGITNEIDLRAWRVNHYFIRSRAQWLAKLRRGYRDVTRVESDFLIYDQNVVHDRTAARLGADVRALLASASLGRTA